MESSQESSTASTEAAQEGSSSILKFRLELTIISFLATPFMQRLTLCIEPVLMLAMALLFM